MLESYFTVGKSQIYLVTLKNIFMSNTFIREIIEYFPAYLYSLWTKTVTKMTFLDI